MTDYGSVLTDVLIGDERRAINTIGSALQGKPVTTGQWLDTGLTIGSDLLYLVPGVGQAALAAKVGAKGAKVAAKEAVRRSAIPATTAASRALNKVAVKAGDLAQETSRKAAYEMLGKSTKQIRAPHKGFIPADPSLFGDVSAVMMAPAHGAAKVVQKAAKKGAKTATNKAKRMRHAPRGSFLNPNSFQRGRDARLKEQAKMEVNQVLTSPIVRERMKKLGAYTSSLNNLRNASEVWMKGRQGEYNDD